MIRSSTYFASIGPFSLAKTRTTAPVFSGGMRDGSVDTGGINLRMFVEDGETSSLGQHPTWGFPLSLRNGTPVADMLTHSSPLPLAIDYSEKGHDISAEDEEGSILALRQRDRVRRVRLYLPVRDLQKLIVAMDDEYPILEYLIIVRSFKDTDTSLIFPETLQAPHLRHLTLRGFALPIGSRLLTTAVGLVTLYLVMVHPSTYFHPNTLLQWISSMPQLETLVVGFSKPVPGHDVGSQLTHTPITTLVTLPNLLYFMFQGVSTYLEALVHRITSPRLEKLEIIFFNQLTFSVPRLLQSIITTENLRFDSVGFNFSDEKVGAALCLHEEFEMFAAAIVVNCCHLDWQVSSMAQISNSLSQVFSAVEHLTLEHDVHSQSSEEHNEVDRTEWRKLLRPFTSVNTLWIEDGLVDELSRCLEFKDGELPLELLPELQELGYSGSGDTGGAFTSFIDARQNASQPVTLVRR